jgi:hypothetical protein
MRFVRKPVVFTPAANHPARTVVDSGRTHAPGRSVRPGTLHTTKTDSEMQSVALNRGNPEHERASGDVPGYFAQAFLLQPNRTLIHRSSDRLSSHRA